MPDVSQFRAVFWTMFARTTFLPTLAYNVFMVTLVFRTVWSISIGRCKLQERGKYFCIRRLNDVATFPS